MKIIIIGCGRVGAGLAQIMSRSSHKVTVVDSDPVAFERLGPAFKGQVVPGICFDRNVLMKSGIEKADALAAVTASDEANLITARLARQVFHVPRVAARVYEPRKAEIYQRLGIQTISPVAIGTNRLANLISYAHLEASASLGDGQVSIVEVDIPRLFIGREVSALSIPGKFQIMAITRNSRTFLPREGAVFQKGDIVHLAVQSGSTKELDAMLG
jgi:trk system potassium uptake protein TrkA